MVLWDVRMCTLADGYELSGRMCCLHLQGTKKCHKEIIGEFREGYAGNRAIKKLKETSGH
jgi:hypothetical protein